MYAKRMQSYLTLLQLPQKGWETVKWLHLEGPYTSSNCVLSRTQPPVPLRYIYDVEKPMLQIA